MQAQRFLAARLGSGSAVMRRWIIIVMVLVAGPTMAMATEIIFSPSEPQIGETITFRIIGASGSVSGVRWSFGEAACPDSGFVNPSTCSLPDYFDCLIQGFSYPTAGVKDVTMSFKVDGMSQPSLAVAVTVANIGVCPGETPCAAVIEPQVAEFPDTGGQGLVSITTVPGCSWSASVDADWIGLGEPPIGSGVLSYTVAQNHGGQRSAVLTIAGKEHVVTQLADPCSYVLDPPEIIVGTAGGVFSFEIQTEEGCHWSVVPLVSWLDVVGPVDGGGPAVISIEVAGVPGEAGRDGTVEVHGQYLTVLQEGYPDTDFSISDALPEVGQMIELQAGEGLVPVAWHLGAANCQAHDAAIDCTSLPAGACDRVRWSYAGPGAVMVRLTTTSGSQAKEVEIQSEGQCCLVASPPEVEIRIEPEPVAVGRPVLFTAFEPGVRDEESAKGGLAAATWWRWSLSSNGQTVASSEAPSFSHVFEVAGSYLVYLTAGNCFGPRTAAVMLMVQPRMAGGTALVVPAAVHSDGLNGTHWRSDLRLFNPSSESIDVDLQFLPEGVNNHDGVIIGRSIELAAGATRIFSSVHEAIPGLLGESLKGALRIDSGAQTTAKSAKAAIVSSRTYTLDDGWSYGQFVPAMAVAEAADREFCFTGVENDDYRSNVGVLNLGAVDSPVDLVVSDVRGFELGRLFLMVPGEGSLQVVQILKAIGVDQPMDHFSVRLESPSSSVVGSVSVIDNRSGDPWMFSDHYHDHCVVHVPGVARTTGVNGSEWRSDVVFLNAGSEPLSARVEYVSGSLAGARPFVHISNMAPGTVYPIDDVVGTLVGGSDDSLGYLVVTPEPGQALPRISARTYTQAGDQGTMGQGLKAFCSRDLINEGSKGYIAGLTTHLGGDRWSRVNLGLLNTDRSQSSRVVVTLLDAVGEELGNLPLGLEPGRLLQFNLFDRFDVIGEVTGSVIIEVVEGGAVAAYASEVDQLSNDPILIPAWIPR